MNTSASGGSRASARSYVVHHRDVKNQTTRRRRLYRGLHCPPRPRPRALVGAAGPSRTDEGRRGLTALSWSNVNPYSTFRLDMDKRLDLAGRYRAAPPHPGGRRRPFDRGDMMKGLQDLHRQLAGELIGLRPVHQQ